MFPSSSPSFRKKKKKKTGKSDFFVEEELDC